CITLNQGEKNTTVARAIATPPAGIPIDTKWYFGEEGKEATITAQVKKVQLIGDAGMGRYNIVEAGPKITIRFDAQGTSTGVEKISAAGEKTCCVYDVNGRMVLKNVALSEVAHLNKGIYVCKMLENGKVVGIKKIVNK
ncbi:MAG TPA: hypothetical protein VIQ97_04125, partial [Prevotella sp.]